MVNINAPKVSLISLGNSTLKCFLLRPLAPNMAREANAIDNGRNKLKMRKNPFSLINLGFYFSCLCIYKTVKYILDNDLKWANAHLKVYPLDYVFS